MQDYLATILPMSHQGIEQQVLDYFAMGLHVNL